MGESKLGFREWVPTSKVYFQKRGDYCCVIHNILGDRLGGVLLLHIGICCLFMYAFFYILYIIFALLFLMSFVWTNILWATGAFIVWLIMVPTFITIWYNIITYGRLMLLTNQNIFIFRLLPFPHLTRVSRAHIKKITVFYEEQFDWHFGKEDNKEERTIYYLLGIEYENGKSSLIKFYTPWQRFAEDLKDILEHDKKISTLEWGMGSLSSLYIIKLYSKIIFSIGGTKHLWSDLAKDIGILILLVGSYFFYFQYVWGGLIVVFFILIFIIFWEIYTTIKFNWNNIEVVVTPSYMESYRVRTPFLKDCQILRQDIALISTIALGENRYGITVVSHTGAIQELPIVFESEEQAEEQAVAMKELLKLK